MSWEKARRLNQDPEFSSADVSGTQMDEPFVWLMGHYVDSVTIDGHRLTAVTHMSRQQDGSMIVTCNSESGLSHLFTYDPVNDGPVSHMLIENPEV